MLSKDLAQEQSTPIINGFPFLSGDKTESLKIEANRSNTIQTPLAFTFENIYKAWENLRDKDTTRYQFKGDFAFKQGRHFFDYPIKMQVNTIREPAPLPVYF